MEFFLFLFLGGFIWLLIYVNFVLPSKTKKTLQQIILNSPDIKVTNSFIGMSDSGIGIDEVGKKIVLAKCRDQFAKNIQKGIYSFDDIVSVEILEDGNASNTVSRSSQLGNAVVGGLLFGGVGAVIGGASAARKAKVKNIALKIIVNDNQNPTYIINFFSANDSGIQVGGMVYKAIMEGENGIHKWHGRLSLIIKQGEQSVVHIKNDTVKVDLVDEIDKLSKLLEKGVITNEEFVQAKAKLLS